MSLYFDLFLGVPGSLVSLYPSLVRDESYLGVLPQELQLTGLTQQLVQLARPGTEMAETTLDRLQGAITAAMEEALEVLLDPLPDTLPP